MDWDLVIHIGLRKTGSSALQEILDQEREVLLEHGIDYPKPICPYPAHQELAWSLLENDLRWKGDTPYDREEVYDYYCRIIDENIEQGRTTLLSSEDLSLLTFEFSALMYIKNRFSSYRYIIVYFVREPLEYLISNYKHALVAGRETSSFSDYVFVINRLLFSDEKLMRHIWKSFAGQENVKTLKYDKKIFQEKSIFSVFLLNVFNIEIEDKYIDYKSNAGIPNEAVDYVLALNRSQLPDEDIKRIKGLVRKYPIGNDRDKFLRDQLSPEEIRLIKKWGWHR